MLRRTLPALLVVGGLMVVGDSGSWAQSKDPTSLLYGRLQTTAIGADNEVWSKVFAHEGFEEKSDGYWILRDAEGSVTVRPFQSSKETVTIIMFFPSKSREIAGPILADLLRRTESLRISGTSAITLDVGTSAFAGCRIAEELTANLSTGHAVTLTATVSCPTTK